MQKHFSGGVKEWLMLAAGAALLLAALFLPLRFALAEPLTAEEAQLLNAWQNGEIIRIHVIANSDSPQDQALKLKVRDALIEAFGQLLAQEGEKDCEAVYQALEQNMEHMQRIAQECAQQNGFDGNVHTECGLLHLPEKQYGSITLPEGEYYALRITLGDGKGRNWWCVLYPQLCLSLSENNEVDKSRLFWSSERIFRCWLLLGK